MMPRIIGSSLKSRVVVLALAAIVMVLGVTQFRDMARDVLPEFSRPTVEVQTEALGLSAQDVEQLITVPIEQDLLNGVAFLDKMRSKSVPGLSSIELVFERGTDLVKARQVVNERLTQAHALPNVSQPPQMLQPLSSTSRVMMFELSSKSLSLIDLGVLARWTVRPRLMGVPGVANVAVWGQRERQLQVQVDPAQLQAKNVTLDEVITTTGNALWWSPLGRLEANTPGTGGFIDAPQQRLGVFHESPIKTPKDLAQVAIESSESPGAAAGAGAATERESTTATTTPLKLGEVAEVVDDHQPLIGDAVLSGAPGILLVIEKFPEANAVAVTRGVEDALGSLAPGLAGVEIGAPLFRPATYIERSTDGIFRAVLIGLALLLLFVLAVLFEWRTALVAAVAVVLSMAAAVVLVNLAGESLNAMVLSGLVLAMVLVVDDVIAGTASVKRRLRQYREVGGAGPTSRTVLESSLEVRSPLAYATVVLLLTLVPIFVLKGEAGAFLPSFALAFGAAVVASMIVSLTVTPALSAYLLTPGSLALHQAPLARWLRSRDTKVLNRVVRDQRPAYAAAAVLLLLGLAAVPFLGRGGSLVPTFKDRDLLVTWDAAPGTSLTEMDRITGRATSELKALPGVRSVGAHVGRAVMADQVVGVNSSQLWVSIAPSADYEKTVTSVEDVVNGYPGLAHKVLTYPNERIEQVLGQEDRDVTVRVYGHDLATLGAKANEVQQAMSKVDGVVGPTVQRQDTEPTFEVKVNLAAAEGAGLKPGDVRRAAAALLSGIGVGALFEDQKVFDVVVWGTPQTRSNLTNIRELLIDTPNRGHVRLGDVADVGVTSAPDVIRHADVSRSIDVTADVSGRGVGAAAGDVNDRLASIAFPVEYHAEVLGDYAQRSSDRRTFIAVCVAVAVGVLLLLQAALGTWRLAALMLLALPLALVGGVLASLIDGGTLTVGSIMALFAVFGIATRSSVVFINRCQHLERHASVPRGEVVVGVTRELLGPILLTAAGSALLLLPFLFFGDSPGGEVVRPMAVVVLGGLVTSTLVSLLVVPALYARFAPSAESLRAAAVTVEDLLAVDGDGNGDRPMPQETDPVHGNRGVGVSAATHDA